MSAAVIKGFVEPGFEPVRDAFLMNFERHGEVGAATCVYREGRPVVDLFGGLADPASGRPWEEDTVVLVFSTTKGVTAICAHLLVERGQLDLDAPVARYWPEFAANGKAKIPVRWLLSHRAGLAAVEGDVTPQDVLGWDGVVRAIAAQAPNWEPGTAHGYHARSYGWTLGEVVRRVSGRSLGRFLRDEIAGPLELSIWVGLPESEDRRCAPIVPARDLPGTSFLDLLGPESLLARVMSGPSELFRSGYDESWNRREMRAAEMPSSNGVADARSLARLYAAVIGEVDGLRLLRPETVARASTVESRGMDRVIPFETCFGLGFSLPPMLVAGCGPRSFGHPGAGGSLAFADPDAGIAFGYVMNQMKLGVTADERAAGLVAALYRCL